MKRPFWQRVWALPPYNQLDETANAVGIVYGRGRENGGVVGRGSPKWKKTFAGFAKVKSIGSSPAAEAARERFRTERSCDRVGLVSRVHALKTPGGVFSTKVGLWGKPSRSAR